MTGSLFKGKAQGEEPTEEGEEESQAMEVGGGPRVSGSPGSGDTKP